MASLAEVIVTAQKRKERLIDTPESVTVVSADSLQKMGATQFSDWATTVPGLSFATAGAGFTQVTLRGVTVGNDVGPTVGSYVDDVPIGSSTAFTMAGKFAFDATLLDLAGVEVLRGPQGTLYGASAMGGLIRYDTKQPDTKQFGGDARAGLSETENGGTNYNVAAAVNIPLMQDRLALRTEGYDSHDGGYIDNVALGQKDVNHSKTSGGHIDLLLTPTDNIRIGLNAFAQDISRAGEATADYTFSGAQPYGSLGQYRRLAEPFDQQFRLVSASVNYDMPWATLTTISGYQTVRTNFDGDISSAYLPLLSAFGLGPYSAVGYTEALSTDKYTQEVRLASPRASRPFQWLLGGFYTHESSGNAQHFNLRDLAGLPAPNILYKVTIPTVYEEYAAFGNVTWYLTDKFDVTGGLRYAQNNQAYSQVGSGILIGSVPTTRSHENVITYLANARYHISDRATAYLRYATGYRPGGPNMLVRGGPPNFQADRLKSYEAGIKAETATGRFSLDLSGYYLDWSNIQLQAIYDGFGEYVNAPGGAKITGAELTGKLRPAAGLVLTTTMTYTHGYMSQGDAALGAAQGERLPGSPRFADNLDIDYYLPLNSNFQPTVGATMTYVGNRTAGFNNSASVPQYFLPSYTSVDLRAGFAVDAASVHPVHVQLYAHNILDKRGQLSVLEPNFGARVAIIQPRTIGVTVSTEF